MGLFGNSRARRPIVASAGKLVKGGSPVSAEAMINRRKDWQKRVLHFADAVPEVGHAASYVCNSVQRVRLEVKGAGGLDQILTDMLVDYPIGRVTENLFLVGEMLVAYKPDEDEPTNVKWKSFGKEDYAIQRDKLLLRGKGGKMEEPDPELNLFNIFRMDRADRTKVWSTHKPMLDVLEAMYVHQLADSAIATSRLAGAGILYVPNDEMMDMPDVDGADAEPEPGSQAHFEQTLRNAFADSIKNREVADAYTPLIMFGAAEYANGLKHLLTERVDNAEAYASRMRAYKERYGSGIDIPAEVVTGMGETNHWAAWKIDQNTWSYYLRPMVEMSTDALLRNFIRPVAAELGVPENAPLRIELDPTDVIVKPDRTDAAIRLFSVGALSAEAAVKAAGFDPADVAPNADAPRSVGEQPDGMPRMPGANFRGSEGQPIGDRNFER
jgi:hypothetical protein